MAYLNTLTMEYPRHIGDLYLVGYKDGENLPNGWVEVAETERPEFEENQKVKEIMPALIGGVWTQQWEIVDLTEEEIEFINDVKNNGIRAVKNLLLQ